MIKNLALSLFALAALAAPSFATHRVAFRSNLVVRPFVSGYQTFGYGGYSQQVVAPVVGCQQAYAAPQQVVAPVAVEPAYAAPVVSNYAAPVVTGYNAQAFVGGYGAQAVVVRHAVAHRAFVTQRAFVANRAFVTPVVRRNVIVRQPVVVRRAPGLNIRVPGLNLRLFR